MSDKLDQMRASTDRLIRCNVWFLVGIAIVTIVNVYLSLTRDPTRAAVLLSHVVTLLCCAGWFATIRIAQISRRQQ